MTARRIQLRITEVAARAIIEQADYYSREESKRLALRWEKAVTRTIDSLLKMPEQGPQCHFEPLKLKRLRRISVADFPRHLVFYEYLREERAIRIVHVLHGARNIEAMLATLPAPLP